jgi:hypothetical protein
MSIASLGIIGGLASTTAPQRAAETAERAENAAGIGQTEEDSQTSERDADGRRPWEKAATDKKTTAKKPDDVATDPSSPLAKDPTGDCGGQLDLVG